MCGIAGYCGRGTHDQLVCMGRAIERRGPDDEGFFDAPGVGFTFRRLSIIDLAGGHQPLSNEDGSIWVMLNGEIYGFGVLRDELSAVGHVFRSGSDAEVIVHAYEQWGENCFQMFDGMFAIAIWDNKNSRLLLARDRLGKKPLYWTDNGGSIWFASELKALLAAQVIKRDINLSAITAYFRSDYIPTPQTIFKNVYKLEPGTVLAWRGGKEEKRWSFWVYPKEEVTKDRQTFIDGFKQRIDRAVAERLVSDVPLGLFLSGGLDSAVVAESAMRQSSRLQAFTIAFEDQTHDESVAASEVARALGLDHHIEKLTPEAALRMLDEAIELLDEPMADPAILPQLLLSRFTRQSVTVALSGDGGDELLLGYQHIPAHIWATRLSYPLRLFCHPLAWTLEQVPAGEGYFSKGFKAQRLARGLSRADFWGRDLAWRGACTPDLVAKMLLPDVRQDLDLEAVTKQLTSFAREAPNPESWSAWSWAYLKSYLMDDALVKVDRATMWFALEARAPLLDRRVISYLLNASDDFKLRNWKGKRLFKEVLRGKVPDKILNRPKHGFGVPISEWIKGPLKNRLNEFSDPVFLRKQGIFDAETVTKMMRDHDRSTDRRKEIWAYLIFQLWYSRWML